MAELVEWSCDWLAKHAQRNGKAQLLTEHPQFREVVQMQLEEEIATQPQQSIDELEALWETLRPIMETRPEVTVGEAVAVLKLQEQRVGLTIDAALDILRSGGLQ